MLLFSLHLYLKLNVMAKKQKARVDKTYKLVNGKTPLSYTIPSKDAKRYPLKWFDETKGENRSLRYASNHPSVFQDEQKDDQVVLDPIVFIDGMLTVSRDNQALQKFMDITPSRGKLFIELDKAKDAEDELAKLESEISAQQVAKDLSLAKMEMIGRVLFNKDVGKMDTTTLKRDIMVFARNEPAAFLEAINDPETELKGKIQLFFDKNILQFRKENKEVYFNTPSNKGKMLNIPFGEEPMYVIASHLQTDDGIEILQYLEKLLND